MKTIYLVYDSSDCEDTCRPLRCYETEEAAHACVKMFEEYKSTAPKQPRMIDAMHKGEEVWNAFLAKDREFNVALYAWRRGHPLGYDASLCGWLEIQELPLYP